MDIQSLAAELTSGHPVTGGYSDDASLAASQINAVNRTTNKTSMTGTEVMNAIDSDEFAALSASDKQTVWNVLHLGHINPFGVEATLLTGVFNASGPSATIAALAEARKNHVSRAQEIGLGLIRPGCIIEARM